MLTLTAEEAFISQGGDYTTNDTVTTRLFYKLMSWQINKISYVSWIGPWQSPPRNLHPSLMKARFFFDFHLKQKVNIFGRRQVGSDIRRHALCFNNIVSVPTFRWSFYRQFTEQIDACCSCQIAFSYRLGPYKRNGFSCIKTVKCQEHSFI